MAEEKKEKKKEILNLDAFVKKAKSIQYKGKEYEVEELSVENLLEIMDIQQKLQHVQDTKELIPLLADIIQKVVPSLEKEEISKMSLKQLVAIINFIKEDITGETDEKNFLQET